MELQSSADKYNSWGLSVVPINEHKQAFNWKRDQSEIVKHSYAGSYGMALVCGKISGNIQCIDFDTKYDLTGTLMHRYREMMDGYDSAILKKLVWQKSPSGGFHAFYRCEEVGGNVKLADRESTLQERETSREKRYNDEIKEGKSEIEAREKAQKAFENDTHRVLIETRGEGGYVGIAPTPGYSFITGTLEHVPTITTAERKLLLDCARNFNEYFKPTTNHVVKKMQFEGKSPFEDYNERGDCVSLLVSHGWKIVKEQGPKILLRRPGSTDAVHSGNFDRDKNWFSVFSTSTEFEAQTPYMPYAVYAMLECKGDYSEAARQLLKAGYGEAKKKEEIVRVRSRIKKGQPLDFIVTKDDYREYIDMLISRSVPQGLTTGIPEFDEFWRFKRANFNVINGHDNVGKSVVLWYFCLLAAMYHGWKSIVYSSENKPGTVVRKLIEFYSQQHIESVNIVMRRNAEKFIEDHFTFIKNDDLYNYRELLDMGSEIMSSRKHDIFLIDPYNSLSVEIPKGSVMNTHDYHYTAASELRMWAKKNDCCVYVNMHAVTSASRLREDGHPVAPHKADTEGGTKFSAKADDFWTIHRLVYDPIFKRQTEIHIRKVKEMETGGSTTDKDKPFLLTLDPSGSRFRSKSQFDPVQAWHSKPTQISFETSPKTITPAASTFRESSQSISEAQEPLTAKQIELEIPIAKTPASGPHPATLAEFIEKRKQEQSQ